MFSGTSDAYISFEEIFELFSWQIVSHRTVSAYTGHALVREQPFLFMRPLPQWLKDKAAAQRRIRLSQPRVSSADARQQFEHVMYGTVSQSPRSVASVLR